MKYIFLQCTCTHAHTHTHTHAHTRTHTCTHTHAHTHTCPVHHVCVVSICCVHLLINLYHISTSSSSPPNLHRYISSLFCAMIFKEAWTQGLCLWSTVTRRFLLLVPMCGWTKVQSAIHPRQVFRMDFLSIYVRMYIHTYVRTCVALNRYFLSELCLGYYFIFVCTYTDSALI